MERVNRYNDYDYEVADNDDYDLKDNADSVTGMNPEEVLEEEIKREQSRLKLTLDLMAKQSLLMSVRTANRLRQTRDRINNIVKEIEEKVQMYGNDYTVSEDVKKSTLREYKRQLEEFSNKYKEIREYKLDEIKDCENRQYEAMDQKSVAMSKKKKMLASKEYKKYLHNRRALVEEINQAVDDEDYEKEQIKRRELSELKKRDPILQYNKEIDEADNKIEEMEYMISEAEAYLENWDKVKENILNKIEKDKNEAFSLVKQNFWQKLVGSIYNRFHKLGKVKDNVVQKIKELTDKAKEEYQKVSEEHARQQEERAKILADIQKEKEAARTAKVAEKAQIKADKAAEKAQVKADKAEAKRRRNEDIIKGMEDRLNELNRQLETARSQSAQYNGKNMTPALAGGNGNIVPFEGRD